MQEERQDNRQWYAIRVMYRREIAVKSWLDERGIGNYLPMQEVEKSCYGRKRKVQAPLIHNLIFIRSSADEMREIKSRTALPVCYIMNRATKSPIVVPDREMKDFMAVVAARGCVETVEAHELELITGDRVRVTEGPFRGIEGRCVRHKGRTKIAVEICEVATALTAYIPLKYIEKIA